MISVVSIELNRVEGKTVKITVATFAHANRVLYQMADTAPHYGYDKVMFELIFEDGETYKGRYDLRHWSVESPNLEKHIRDHVNFMAGYLCPTNMKPHDYESFVKDFKDHFRQFKHKYRIGDAPM